MKVKQLILKLKKLDPEAVLLRPEFVKNQPRYVTEVALEPQAEGIKITFWSKERP